MSRMDALGSYSKRVAIMDADRVLIDDIGSVEFLGRLVKQNLFDKNAYDQIVKQIYNLKNGRRSHNWVLYECTGLYSEGLNGKPVDSVRDIGKEVAMERLEQVYPYTRELLETLGGYFKILVTGGVQEVAQPFGKKLGFDRVLGTQKNSENGIYTIGLRRKMYEEDKARLCKNTVDSECLSMDYSIGIGDTSNDTFLQVVDYSIVLKPEPELRAWAEAEKAKRTVGSVFIVDDESQLVPTVKRIIG